LTKGAATDDSTFMMEISGMNTATLTARIARPTQEPPVRSGSAMQTHDMRVPRRGVMSRMPGRPA
jgi:hypothetical protein